MKYKKKEYSFIDLFAGAGGFGLGFILSGHFEPLCSVERDLWAVNTLRRNNSHLIIHADITKISTKKQILSICDKKPDVIIGGPPCQGFSVAGKGDKNDPRNSLFKYFVKWVAALQPKVFVMENVTGILARKNAGGEDVVDIIKKAFSLKGYYCQVWTLNAADYGVPQMRQRIFIVGNKYGKNIDAPKKTHSLGAEKGLKTAITAWEAIGDLPQIFAGEGREFVNYDKKAENSYQKSCRCGSDGVYNHVAMQHTKRLVNRYKMIMDGCSITALPDELKVRKRCGKGEYSNVVYCSNYRYIKPNTVSFTIPASFYSNFIHPFIPRNITAREAARIQSFPDWYVFEGKRTQISSKLLAKLGKEEENHLSQYNQIGNAVPPLLAKAIAKTIAEFITKENAHTASSTTM